MIVWHSVVGKLWVTIMVLVALVISTLGLFLLPHIDLEYGDKSSQIKHLFFMTSVIGFLLTTILAFFLMFKITQPLRNLKIAANAIAQGEYRSRVDASAKDEIGELAEAFNRMADQLERTIQDLQYEKEHVASILRSMTDAVVTFGTAGQIVATNPHGEKLLRVWAGRNTSLVGHHIMESWMPEDIQRLYVTASTEDRELSLRLDTPKATWSVVMDPLYAHGGRIGVVAVLRDVTEEARLDKLRNDFVANVSHELRTPIALIQGYSEALTDDVVATVEEQRELIEIIYSESVRMGRLVNDLLDLARLQARKVELQLELIDMVALLQHVVRKFIAVAKDASVQLHVQGEEGLYFHEGDSLRLEQVFTNLIDNAIRHSYKGHTVTVHYTNPIPQHVRIDVIDTGEGISSEDLPYVFERFYKADKSRKREQNPVRTGGTGLGLAIVHQLVEAHGGTISVASEKGQGTTFSVTLPLHSAKEG